MNRKFLGCLAGLLCLSLMGTAVCGGDGSASTRRPEKHHGELGSDLDFLRRHYAPPASPGESNHYVDLWTGTTLPLLARLNGLTNNRTLFVDSHGRGERSLLRRRYVFYPHHDLAPRGRKLPRFTARDLATVLGPAANEIHNVVVGGCNVEGAFDPREIRKYFVNATNIVHAVAGDDGFKSMFYSAIVNPSAANRPMYATPGRNREGRTAYRLADAPSADAIKVNPYMAALFHPGAAEPYQTQIAGRELLEPPGRQRKLRAPIYDIGPSKTHLVIQTIDGNVRGAN